MASPLFTFKQMFGLMKRETHHHPEVRHFLSQQRPTPEHDWIDLDVEDHVEKLRELAASADSDDRDKGGDDDHREAA